MVLYSVNGEIWRGSVLQRGRNEFFDPLVASWTPSFEAESELGVHAFVGFKSRLMVGQSWGRGHSGGVISSSPVSFPPKGFRICSVYDGGTRLEEQESSKN